MKLHISIRSLICSVLVVSVLPRCLAQDATTSRKAVQVPETEMAKRLLNVVAPKLPEGALLKCSNALLMLKITIDETGKVSDAEVRSGYAELRESAITAIKQWTYKAFEQHGNAIAVRTQVSIFYLGDGEFFPMYSPDGKGGFKGGNMIPLPPGCGAGPTIKRQPEKPANRFQGDSC
jgi:TonB family protein